MNQVIELKLKVIKQTALISFVIIAFTFGFGYSEFAFGLFYGTIIAIINWLLLAKTVQNSVGFSPQKAKFYAVAHYMLRFFIIFLAMYIAAMREDIHILGAILALFIPKLAILWEYLVLGFLKNKSKENKN
ncbi:ATP synthase subunit I [Natranaerobius thermophilus]|uniref:ATP synthase I n=1 Tax=Natranaerobius thermophilus (strain ATCC BAA-1301 / DSM 18059 / JW/NM-WN-LF) TaxID=457570 RepID=B2A3H0_NATTJ|nr:ATP synthase subunit I [Natranaerobius thermophilus]ACB86399.1 conserved hypothetical protein [Natranaerobius thermophilus JW/NM-WN-LF]